MMHGVRPLAVAVGVTLFVTALVRADEGMWLFNDPPRALLQARHGFAPDEAWLAHVQRASVRFSSSSGSFASADGLVVTNHHVGRSAIQKLGTAQRDIMRDGFLARRYEDELRCHDLELTVLQSIEDVTERVEAAVAPGMDADAAFAARRAAIAAIEKASHEATGLRSDVITLYQGARYHLYRSRRYTDVRLVFAPEGDVAHFGGDVDNFEFPRHCLDVAFFRAWENGAPARVEHWLAWSIDGVAPGELVFISGHPGRTDRLLTVAEVEAMRDVQVPWQLRLYKQREVMLANYAARGAEQARLSRQDLLSTQNNRKRLDGRVQALLDPAFWESKGAAEARLVAFATTRPEFSDVPAALERIVAAEREQSANAPAYLLLESSLEGGSRLASLARRLVRSAAERTKPNGERLKEYRDSGRASLELALFSTAPIDDGYESARLKEYLAFLAQALGAESEVVRAALGGATPSARAQALVGGSRVRDLEFRRKAYTMTPEELAATGDPLLAWAAAIDPGARAARRIEEMQEDIKRRAHARLGAARFAMLGASVYPDATSSLRLAIGTVEGYTTPAGEVHAPFTQLRGLYARSRAFRGERPFGLPPTWAAAEGALALDTPFNFAFTADTIGGNSGSPVINRAGRFVGVNFDGNIESLGNNLGRGNTRERAIAVDARAMIEALRHVYHADELVAELLR